MMRGVILEPLLSGLSMGLFCALTRYPFLLPLFAAANRRPRDVLRTWLQFLAGRLAGYLLFGAAAGWLGERFGGGVLHLLSTLGMMLMAALLVSYALGFWRPAWSLCPAGSRRAASVPALCGFLTGVNVCPPFLLSLAYVFTLHSLFKGVVYFLVLFFATSLHFIPLLFAGLLGRMPEFRRAARLAAALVGSLFLMYGALMLLRMLPTHPAIEVCP